MSSSNQKVKLGVLIFLILFSMQTIPQDLSRCSANPNCIKRMLTFIRWNLITTGADYWENCEKKKVWFIFDSGNLTIQKENVDCKGTIEEIVVYETRYEIVKKDSDEYGVKIYNANSDLGFLANDIIDQSSLRDIYFQFFIQRDSVPKMILQERSTSILSLTFNNYFDGKKNNN